MESDSRRIAIDSSAWIAIRFEEPGHERLVDKLVRARTTIVSAPTMLETAMLLTRKFPVDPRAVLDRDLKTFGIKVVPLLEPHTDSAIRAFLRYGKGRHPAKLNFGDCISYALASHAGIPLLYTGDDFAKTDIEAA